MATDIKEQGEQTDIRDVLYGAEVSITDSCDITIKYKEKKLTLVYSGSPLQRKSYVRIENFNNEIYLGHQPFSEFASIIYHWFCLGHLRSLRFGVNLPTKLCPTLYFDGKNDWRYPIDQNNVLMICSAGRKDTYCGKINYDGKLFYMDETNLLETLFCVSALRTPEEFAAFPDLPTNS